jgi:hypothetical protein
MFRKLIFLVILLLVSANGFAKSYSRVNPDSIPFAPAVKYDVGDAPGSVFCADLDGDGYLDLAVANSGLRNPSQGNTISILKNNGDGTFQSKHDYPTGAYPHSVFAADVDADGYVDLVLPNLGSNTISVLKNNGDGSFSNKTDYNVGYQPSFVSCADLDGDGDLPPIFWSNFRIKS